ncbi:MAG: hypothetical protein KDE27_10130 [Planctomycetes bacterium]|nr:hypothetical protein [Planctomycetota bacterium]
MRSLQSTLLLTALATSAAAQTFVVDINNGPGTDFTEIAAAVAAVPEGAVLTVRPGGYLPFHIDGKSLALLGGPSVYVAIPFLEPNAIEITNLASHQSVNLRSIGIGAPLGVPRISVRNCDGPVVLDNLQIRPDTVTALGGRVVVSDCDHVLLVGSHLAARGLWESPIESYNSQLTIDDCYLGSSGLVLRQGGGRIQVNNCRIEHENGGPALVTALLYSTGGEVLLHGDTILIGQGAEAGLGTGTIVLDPSTLLLNVTPVPFDPNLTIVQRAIPSLDVMTGPLGGSAVALLEVPAGNTGLLAVGFPATPYQVPGVIDPVWIGEGVLRAIGSGPVIAAGYAIPNDPSIRGVSVRWQGLVLEAGQFLASNVSGYVHY